MIVFKPRRHAVHKMSMIRCETVCNFLIFDGVETGQEGFLSMARSHTYLLGQIFLNTITWSALLNLTLALTCSSTGAIPCNIGKYPTKADSKVHNIIMALREE